MSQIVGCRQKPCGNRTANPTGYCYAHEHLGLGLTPGGQYIARRSGGLSLEMKLSKESSTPIPADTLNVPGFPYFTSGDLSNYRYFLSSGDPRYSPPRDIILDRFPVTITEVDGRDISGGEVGVYGSSASQDDDLFAFAPNADGSQNDGDRISETIRLFRTPTGAAFMIDDNRRYQVVRVDRTTIDAL